MHRGDPKNGDLYSSFDTGRDDYRRRSFGQARRGNNRKSLLKSNRRHPAQAKQKPAQPQGVTKLPSVGTSGLLGTSGGFSQSENQGMLSLGESLDNLEPLLSECTAFDSRAWQEANSRRDPVLPPKDTPFDSIKLTLVLGELPGIANPPHAKGLPPAEDRAKQAADLPPKPLPRSDSSVPRLPPVGGKLPGLHASSGNSAIGPLNYSCGGSSSPAAGHWVCSSIEF
ncbi:hypothetical protein DIPPA_05195 [Diplonema papillatum]|nr:hypothetical protein DIPPA_05195 [Diplonema papillatum]